jgi:CheY-like chemotaxis protein
MCATSASPLIQLGYRIIEAADSDPALDILTEHPEIAVLFTDVRLPRLNGRQLADEVL